MPRRACVPLPPCTRGANVRSRCVAQVRAAQKGVPTGSVYTTNEGNLASVGPAELQDMLERREWGGIYDGKFTKHNVDVIRGV